jgi:hypothetical protein
MEMMSNRNSKEIQSLVKVNHWREYQARRVLDFWEQSGLNLKQFCREFGIGYKRLQYWKKRVMISASDVVEFVEVVPIESRYPHRDDSMEIVLSNHRSIRVTPGFEESAIRRLIGIVED